MIKIEQIDPVLMQEFVETGSVVIHCQTMEQAKVLVRYIKEYTNIRVMSSFAEYSWINTKEDSCYRISCGKVMNYDHTSYYRKEGYTIWDFEELLIGNELQESDYQIDYLLTIN